MDYKDYMDYDQRDYFFQMQQMRQMPFSLMHPYPDLYMSEIETDRDLRYLQQMYPADAKRMQRKVEEACDKLEYEGSMMYDEYPDRVTMLLICDKIADTLAKEEAEKQALAEVAADGAEELNAMQMRPPAHGQGSPVLPFGPDRRPERPPFDSDERPGRPPHGADGRPQRPPFDQNHGPGRPPQKGPALDPGRRSLLEVLLYNEMHKRRCKHRRARRFW